MAHFAEIDSNNEVLRVLVGCNIDVNNNGGDKSEQAAEHFKKIAPLSENGIKWVQTSYSASFRSKFAGKGDKYDSIRDAFIERQPYPSWTLNNNNNEWEAPIKFPTVTTYGDNVPFFIFWDENSLNWKAHDKERNIYSWYPNSESWLAS